MTIAASLLITAGAVGALCLIAPALYLCLMEPSSPDEQHWEQHR